MKTHFLLVAIGILATSLAGCDKPQADPVGTAENASLPDQKVHLLFEKLNVASGLKAQFYGLDMNPKLRPPQVIDYIIFKDTKTGASVKYDLQSATDQAADFFFADVWSPDGAYLVLPVDKYDGFAIYNSKTALADIKARKPADTIRVWTGAARRYWHVFDGWAGPSTFRFKAELETSSLPFQYDIGTQKLSCTSGDCGREDHARNIKGDVPVQGATK
jgi:hypothetical protein